MDDDAREPPQLRDLESRLRAAEQRTQRPASSARTPPTSLGIAGRFGTELVVALLVGGAIGWGLDWLCARLGFHTRPVFLLVMVVIGAAAGIRNVMRAAKELNAASGGEN